MRRSFAGAVRIFVFAMASVLVNALIAGGIQPSFYLDHASWHATEIILVSATQQGGVFDVVESWKGHLNAGTVVTVHELAPGPDAWPIVMYPKDGTFVAEEDHPSLEIPRQETGLQMILFLNRNTSPDLESRRQAGEWSPGNMYDNDFKTSVVWIDGEQVFAFQQWSNPGPSILVSLEMSKSKMKDRVAEIVKIQRDLDSVSGKDGAVRAAKLKSYARSEIWPVRRFVVEELGKTGFSGTPVIRGVLSDDSYAEDASELVKSYAAAGGEAVAQDLNALLHEQLQFWRARGPSLPEGWWNETELPYREPVQNQYMKTIELIRALQKTNCYEAVSTARELRDFWKSLPQLDEHDGRSQVVEECDRLIDHLSQ